MSNSSRVSGWVEASGARKAAASPAPRTARKAAAPHHLTIKTLCLRVTRAQRDTRSQAAGAVHLTIKKAGVLGFPCTSGRGTVLCLFTEQTRVGRKSLH